MSGNLRQKTITGISWSLIDNLAYQGVAFIVGIIIANFVSPEEYGQLGIILLFIALFNSIVDSGFSNALIRKKDANNVDYCTVFIVNFSTSVGLYVLLFFTSPSIASFFHKSELDLLLKVTGIIIIINAITIIQKTILVKSIDFKTQAKASLIASLLSGIVGIITAVIGLGVWSLVIQQILRQILYTLVIWFFSKWYPKFVFSLVSLKDLFGFGWKLMIVGIIDTAWNELNQVIIGRYYKMYALGQYTRSKQFSDGVTYGLLTVIQRVSYPSLSAVQEDDERLLHVLRKILKMTMFVLTPCILGLAACAEALLNVLIGPQWSDAAFYLQLICISIILSPLRILDQNILQVKKDSGTLLILNIVGKAFAVVPIIIGIFVSIEAMLIATAVVTYIFTTPLTIIYSTKKYLGYGILGHLIDLSKIIAPSFFMSIVVYSVVFLGMNDYMTLVCQILSGIICFVVICRIIRIEEYNDLKLIVLSYLKKICGTRCDKWN